jgi:hypothetical protein
MFYDGYPLPYLQIFYYSVNIRTEKFWRSKRVKILINDEDCSRVSPWLTSLFQPSLMFATKTEAKVTQVLHCKPLLRDSPSNIKKCCKGFSRKNILIKILSLISYFIKYSAHFFTLKMMLKYSQYTIHGR